jgi:hypothetical protein
LLPITSRAGNDHNAYAEGHMHGLTTNWHEGGVSAMLTESGLSIPPPVRDFKGRCDEMQGACKPTSTAFQRVFRLDACT